MEKSNGIERSQNPSWIYFVLLNFTDTGFYLGGYKAQRQICGFLVKYEKPHEYTYSTNFIIIFLLY